MRFLYSLIILLLISIPSISMADTKHPTFDQKHTVTVTLPNQNTQLNYPQPVRLEQLIKDVNKQTDFYHLGAVLSDSNQQKTMNEIYSDIMNALSSLSRQTSLFSARNTFKQSAMQITTQLSKHTFVDRIFTSFDVDLLRINDKMNPLIAGKYQLILHPRPTNVSFFGAIDSENSLLLPLIEHATIDDYLEKVPLSPFADTSTIYVIQPNGDVQTTEFSIWQNKTVYLAPGATVYVPFANLPTDFHTLNDSIVQLLRNKAF
ncbi:capsule biosynthesis GfcC D2 domain-containing protein [Aliivibrio salmonicida]|uniref:capsule biosynthesis GfcC D2 domain-containing protein n=1 Tax=Aliivibrio salmonicida TaxID=40269 RepID=UPI003D0B0FE5